NRPGSRRLSGCAGIFWRNPPAHATLTRDTPARPPARKDTTMRPTRPLLALFATLLLVAAVPAADPQPEEPKAVKDGPPLPGTKPLTMEGDIAAKLVAGVDKFLLREIDRSAEQRAKFWKRDFSSAEAYNKSIQPNRKRLAHILGVRDERVPFDG